MGHLSSYGDGIRGLTIISVHNQRGREHVELVNILQMKCTLA